jgi:hypothetical protein
MKPPFPVPTLLKETLKHYTASGATIIFPDVDVVLEGPNLVTTKATHLLDSGTTSSVFMDHMTMYEQAKTTFKDVFGIDANVNFISFLSSDNAHSSFLITNEDFISNSAEGKSLKLQLLIHPKMIDKSKVLSKIKEEKSERGTFTDLNIRNEDTGISESIILDITLPPGIYPVIASENPWQHIGTPKFYLLFASHYSESFSLLKEKDKTYKNLTKADNFIERYEKKAKIHVDSIIQRSKDGFYPLYGLKSFNVKFDFLKTYDSSNPILFEEKLRKKLYESFFDSILDLLILKNMADAIDLTQLEFQSFIPDFYGKNRLPTSVETDENLETSLRNLYRTGEYYIRSIPNPKMSLYLDFFIKGNLVNLSLLYSGFPELVFENSILIEKDSYSRFKNKDKVPKFINGTSTTPLFLTYRNEQANSLTTLKKAGYKF